MNHIPPTQQDFVDLSTLRRELAAAGIDPDAALQFLRERFPVKTESK